MLVQPALSFAGLDGVHRERALQPQPASETRGLPAIRQAWDFGAMKKMLVLAAASMAALAAPVQAKESAAPERMDKAVAALETLADPAVQRDMGNMLSALIGSLMDLRVGELMNATRDIQLPGQEKAVRMERMDPKATLGDLAGKGDPRFAERLKDDAKAMPKVAGTMAQSLAKMLPIVDAMARDMEAQLEASIEEAKRAR